MPKMAVRIHVHAMWEGDAPAGYTLRFVVCPVIWAASTVLGEERLGDLMAELGMDAGDAVKVAGWWRRLGVYTAEAAG